MKEITVRVPVLSVRPGSRRSSGGYSLANHVPASALGPLLLAPAGATKRETPTSNLTESTGVLKIIKTESARSLSKEWTKT